MTLLSMQRTRFHALQSRISSGLFGQLRRSWRTASLTLISLLVGYFLSQTITSLLLDAVPGGRPMVVLAMVLLVEWMVRLRPRNMAVDPPLGWVIADNLRIGAVYAVVLEAFKLGT